ncbi:hypothetical protein IFR05_000655 [Cadophora sp. M221]|nr:hypothetical protein IFR05_000655 [Cadophora sp. M221]
MMRVVTDVEPLLSNLNLSNGNAILGYSGAILGGIGIGEGLRELVDLANKPPPDTTPTPDQTPEPTPESTPQPTTQSTPTTNQSSTTTGTSTSSSASASETTKPGTSLAAYEVFVNGLPDGGQGMRIVYPHIDYQVYGSYMTVSQVNSIRIHPLVDTVMDSSFVDDGGAEDYSVIPKTLEARVDPDPYPY